jgi:hypothetical protein
LSSSSTRAAAITTNAWQKEGTRFQLSAGAVALSQ